ncbi:hypothetical protein F9817_22900 [Vibrio sp. CAIM 722]|uniref:Uncharacterized protein n=1 Tax=Vibrio eleionomae TaxID=2653505 RepID=A0A7X4RWT2_9VIBR|nr:hypothetical protein [Vibrio eleionomae]MZI96038.1 hypothetical protein [Vibrio eleionomae]
MKVHTPPPQHHEEPQQQVSNKPRNKQESNKSTQHLAASLPELALFQHYLSPENSPSFAGEVEDSFRSARWNEPLCDQLCQALPKTGQSSLATDFSCQILLPNAGEVQMDAFMEQMTWHIRLKFSQKEAFTQAKNQQRYLERKLRKTLEAPVSLTITSA